MNELLSVPQRTLLACAHFDAHECRSCTLLPVATEDRLTRVQAEVAALLDPYADVRSADRTAASGTPAVHATASGSYWGAPVRSPLAGFRNKAKMVVSGTAEAPVLGIVDEDGAGVDLSDCPLYPAPVHAALAALPGLIRRAQVPPYSVSRRRGQLKHVLVTASDAGELMVRFVLRDATPVARIREHIGLLTEAVPGVRVVTANLQPEHSAVLEGPEEVHIWGEDALTVRQGRIPLRVRPQSFLQTNTAVASQLYVQAAEWADAAEAAFRAEAAVRADDDGFPAGGGELRTESDRAEGSGLRAGGDEEEFVVWDLFCGVGGFALHCARPREEHSSRRVIGVEVSAEAIASAQATAAQLGLETEFHAADATTFASGAGTGAGTAASASGPPLPRPDLLIVNPPRRGLGRGLAEWVQDSGIREVIYSSCNPRTLARDLASMPAYRVTAARLLDMFPHTAHSEVVVRLRRAAG
jgi:23S rRNA (uracil747-C5)-methyltransferase